MTNHIDDMAADRDDSATAGSTFRVPVSRRQLFALAGGAALLGA